KVLMDMPVTPEAGPHLRAAGHDEIHAVDLGLARSSDENCSRSHGARNESSLLPTWTIRASLHCSKPTVPASSYSAEARTLTERCLRCSTGSWPAPPHSASVARGHWAPRGGRNPSSMITLLLSLPLRRLSSARPREPSL